MSHPETCLGRGTLTQLQALTSYMGENHTEILVSKLLKVDHDLYHTGYLPTLNLLLYVQVFSI